MQTETGIRLETRAPAVGFDDIVGFDRVYETIGSLLPRFDPDVQAELRQRHGPLLAEPDSTLLLFGPPDCGKAAAAEAVATEIEMSQYLDMDTQFFDIRVNSSVPPEGLNEAFKLLAERMMDGTFPVIHLDDIEAFVPDRTATTSRRLIRLTNTCSEWLTKFTQETDAFVLATSNFPTKADSGVISKFTQLFVPPPDNEGMAEIWRRQLESTGENVGPLDYERLGNHSEGYTPQEITERVIPKLRQTVTQSAVDREDTVVDTELVLTHLEETAPVTVPEYITKAAETTGLRRFPQLYDYLQRQSKTDISM